MMPTTYPIRRHVHLSPVHAARLRHLARACGITESEMIRRLIDQEAERVEQGGPRPAQGGNHEN